MTNEDIFGNLGLIYTKRNDEPYRNVKTEKVRPEKYYELERKFKGAIAVIKNLYGSGMIEPLMWIEKFTEPPTTAEVLTLIERELGKAEPPDCR